MAQIFCKIELDVTKSGSGVFVMAKQGDVDSRFVQIRLVANGKPFDVCESAVVVCAAKREDGATTHFSGRVNGDGTILVPIGGEMLALPGLVTCDVGIIGERGERLTATAFFVSVEAAISPTGIPGEAEESLFGEFFAQRQFYPLSAATVGEKAVFSPLAERNYNVDLSLVPPASDGTQRQIVFALPASVDGGRRAWIYLHLTATEGTTGGFPTLDFGENVMYCDGKRPVFASCALDVICSFSPRTGKWLLRSCTYENAPREQLTRAYFDTEMDAVRAQLLTKASNGEVFRVKTDTPPAAWQIYLPYQTRDNTGALVTGHRLASVTAVADNIPMYGAGGQLRVPQTPSGNTDATSKAYVDGLIGNVNAVLTAILGV